MKEELYIKDSRRGGGFWVSEEVFEMNLDPYALTIYIYLISIADRNSKIATISTRKLAEKLGISRQKVKEALKILQEKGMVVKKQRVSGKGNYYSNVYLITKSENWNKNLVNKPIFEF